MGRRLCQKAARYGPIGRAAGGAARRTTRLHLASSSARQPSTPSASIHADARPRAGVQAASRGSEPQSPACVMR
jgi:hypothetical protein